MQQTYSTAFTRKPVISALFLGVTMSVLADTPPVQPFNPEQIQRNVRVLLLKVERSTVFSKAGFRSPTNDVVHAVPGVGVTCVVEALGNDPKKNWITPSVEVHVAGKKISDIPKNISGGGSSGLSEFTPFDFSPADKPQVTNPKRAVVFKAWLRGLRVPPGKADLHITAGFNDRTERFVFKNVPLE